MGGNYAVCVTIHTFYIISSLLGFCWSLSIALFYSYWRLCSWGHFECASWSFLVHFRVHISFPCLAIGSLWFLFKLFRSYERQVFSLSFMIFDGRVGDLYKSCFAGDFALLEVVIYEALCFDVAQGQMNGAPNETRTHSCRFASLTCSPIHHQRCPLLF